MDSPTAASHPSSGGRPLVGAPDAPESIRRALLSHFDTHARDLPWRRTEDPYAIWVSEVMLQQTRVETVVPYFRRWLERFPTVTALAEAGLEDVLKAWEGLGYYRRARLLHRAATVVQDRHGGRLPASTEELRALPGVGPYTAGAVGSIAFGRVEPAVDGNVRRVLSRLFDLPHPSPTELRRRAARLVDPERPGDFNQALMELGATVCVPRSPACGVCPLGEACRARARGVQDLRPAPRERRSVPQVELGVAVLVRPGADGAPRTFLVRRPPEGLLAGLWEFPGRGPSGDEGLAGAAASVALDAGVAGDGAVRLDPVSHAFSHLRAVYHPFVFRAVENGSGAEEDAADRWGRVESDPVPAPGGNARGAASVLPPGRNGSGWFTPSALEELALPVAQRRIAERLGTYLEGEPPFPPSPPGTGTR